MYNSQKNYELTRNTALLQFGYRLLRGMNAFGRRASRLVIMLASWYSIFALWLIAYGRIDSDNPFIAVVKLAMYVLLALLLAAVPIVLFWCWGGPFDAGTVQRNLIRAGLTNSAGEGPTLIDVIPDSNNPKIKIYKFWVIGIPLSIWQDKIEALQTALNATVAKIIAGKDGRYILVYAAPPVTSLPRTIYWPGDSFKSTALVLGESITGPVTVDLSISPHILIGGSTGSGKTYLVLSLIYQALLKGFATYILDMKGGIDFPMSWKYGLCHYVATRTDILSVLSDLVHELEKRQAKFQQVEKRDRKTCSSLDEYNRRNPDDRLSRILVACDEVAEITDTTGMDKAQKEQVSKIIGYLNTLARLGRAFGLSLIMATQRPDVSVLPGQIKANADVRICGRSDNVLSTIILDNGDAADLPKDIPGRFLCNLNGGTVFQGYIHPDLEEGLI